MKVLFLFSEALDCNDCPKCWIKVTDDRIQTSNYICSEHKNNVVCVLVKSKDKILEDVWWIPSTKEIIMDTKNSISTKNIYVLEIN